MKEGTLKGEDKGLSVFDEGTMYSGGRICLSNVPKLKEEILKRHILRLEFFLLI